MGFLYMKTPALQNLKRQDELVVFSPDDNGSVENQLSSLAGQSCPNRERAQAEGPREEQEQQPQSPSEAEEEPFTYED